MQTLFQNRYEAGRLLAAKLTHYQDRRDAIVLALSRGSTLVAYEISRALQVPLDTLFVRRLWVPGHRDAAFGAIAPHGAVVLNKRVVATLAIPDPVVAAIIATERRTLVRQEKACRGECSQLALANHVVILVDDAMTSAAALRAAIHTARKAGAAKIIVAVPVLASESVSVLESHATAIISAMDPVPARLLRHCYQARSHITDEAVGQLIRHRRDAWPSPEHRSA